MSYKDAVKRTYTCDRCGMTHTWESTEYPDRPQEAPENWMRIGHYVVTIPADMGQEETWMDICHQCAEAYKIWLNAFNKMVAPTEDEQDAGVTP